MNSQRSNGAKRRRNHQKHQKDREKRKKRQEDQEKAKADEARAKNEAEKADAKSLRALSVHARIEDVRKKAGQLLEDRIDFDPPLDPMVTPGIGPYIREFTPGPPRAPTPPPEWD